EPRAREAREAAVSAHEGPAEGAERDDFEPGGAREVAHLARREQEEVAVGVGLKLPRLERARIADLREGGQAVAEVRGVRRREVEAAAGREERAQVPEELVRVSDVLDDLAREDEVEGPESGRRELEEVAGRERDAPRDAVALDARAEDIGAEVVQDDLRARRDEARGEPPVARRDLEHAARLQPPRRAEREERAEPPESAIRRRIA